MGSSSSVASASAAASLRTFLLFLVIIWFVTLCCFLALNFPCLLLVRSSAPIPSPLSQRQFPGVSHLRLLLLLLLHHLCSSFPPFQSPSAPLNAPYPPTAPVSSFSVPLLIPAASSNSVCVLGVHSPNILRLHLLVNQLHFPLLHSRFLLSSPFSENVMKWLSSMKGRELIPASTGGLSYVPIWALELEVVLCMAVVHRPHKGMSLLGLIIQESLGKHIRKKPPCFVSSFARFGLQVCG